MNRPLMIAPIRGTYPIHRPPRTAARWASWWPTAFADALALAEQAAFERGELRRAYLVRAATLLVSTFEMGAPRRGPERLEWARASRRVQLAIRRLTARPVYELVEK